MSFLTGSPEKHERVSTLLPEQKPNFQQLQKAGQGKGAGGAFGTSADYYYDVLNNDPNLINEMWAPELRQFNEEVIPGLAEQFAGMGAGGLSSSGFRNAAVNAGASLSERLGAIRSQLRQNAAQGLQNLGQQTVGNYSQDVVTQQGSEGLLGLAGPAITAGLTALGGPLAGAVGSGLTSWLSNSTKGKSNPYGTTAQGYDQEFRMRGLPS